MAHLKGSIGDLKIEIANIDGDGMAKSIISSLYVDR